MKNKIFTTAAFDKKIDANIFLIVGAKNKETALQYINDMEELSQLNIQLENIEEIDLTKTAQYGIIKKVVNCI